MCSETSGLSNQITYICRLAPSLRQAFGLLRHLESGKRRPATLFLIPLFNFLMTYLHLRYYICLAYNYWLLLLLMNQVYLRDSKEMLLSKRRRAMSLVEDLLSYSGCSMYLVTWYVSVWGSQPFRTHSRLCSPSVTLDL